MEKSINSNTIALYASAPTFPHGVIDPIMDLGKLALKYNIGLHVDNCLGGFISSMLYKNNLISECFDFKVDGVTSISVDLHKYGYSTKGVSSVLYNSKDLRKFQYTIVTDWPGGLYSTASMRGACGGGVIAAAWSTLI